MSQSEKILIEYKKALLSKLETEPSEHFTFSVYALTLLNKVEVEVTANAKPAQHESISLTYPYACKPERESEVTS